MAKCPKCNAEMRVNGKFCIMCGYEMPDFNAPAENIQAAAMRPEKRPVKLNLKPQFEKQQPDPNVTQVLTANDLPKLASRKAPAAAANPPKSAAGQTIAGKTAAKQAMKNGQTVQNAQPLQATRPTPVPNALYQNYSYTPNTPVEEPKKKQKLGSVEKLVIIGVISIAAVLILAILVVFCARLIAGNHSGRAEAEVSASEPSETVETETPQPEPTAPIENMYPTLPDQSQPPGEITAPAGDPTVTPQDTTPPDENPGDTDQDHIPGKKYQVVRVGEDGLAMRDGPDDYANEIKNIPEGAIVYVRDETNEWYWYVYWPEEDVLGYVHAEYLNPYVEPDLNSLITESEPRTQTIEGREIRLVEPRINLESYAVAVINAQIESIYRLDPGCIGITYEKYLNGDILTIVIDKQFNFYHEYYVFNISVPYESELYNGDVIAAGQFDMDSFNATVGELISSFIREQSGTNTYPSEDIDACVNQAIERGVVLSESYLGWSRYEYDQVYLNDNGELILIMHCTLPGDDDRTVILNLSAKQVVDNSKEQR